MKYILLAVMPLLMHAMDINEHLKCLVNEIAVELNGAVLDRPEMRQKFSEVYAQQATFIALKALTADDTRDAELESEAFHAIDALLADLANPATRAERMGLLQRRLAAVFEPWNVQKKKLIEHVLDDDIMGELRNGLKAGLKKHELVASIPSAVFKRIAAHDRLQAQVAKDHLTLWLRTTLPIADFSDDAQKIIRARLADVLKI